jgi:hypothetical protein
LVGCENAIQLTFKYDVKVVVPLLMVCFHWLNPIFSTSAITTINVVGLELEKNMFGIWASIEECSRALVVSGKLSLFKRFSPPSFACADPLACWWMHEGQFPNVGFLAKQILGILYVGL